jgi:hypothetical protein
MKKFFAGLAVLVVLATALSFAQVPSPSTIVGYIAPAQLNPPPALANVGGIVTSSGLVATVTGGVAFCQGQSTPVPSVTLTFPAGTAATPKLSLIVFNCFTDQVYAKGPVIAAGATGTASAVLFAAPPEIPINSVSAGASALTLTDARILSQWSSGITASGAQKQSSANSDYAGIKAASSGTMTYTFVNTWVSAPVCVVSDQTTAAALKAAVTTTTLTVTGATTTDSIAYVCVGNPN